MMTTTAMKNKKLVDRYTYRVAWSPDDGVFVARVAEWPSLAADGDSMDGALRELRSVVGACIEDMKTNGEVPPPPLATRKYSGKLLLRMPPELHRALAADAASQDVPLNQLIVTRLAGGQ